MSSMCHDFIINDVSLMVSSHITEETIVLALDLYSRDIFYEQRLSEPVWGWEHEQVFTSTYYSEMQLT